MTNSSGEVRLNDSSPKYPGLTPQEALDQKKVKFATFGMIAAAFSGLCWAIATGFINVVNGMFPFFDESYSANYLIIAAIVSGAVLDGAGCITVLIYDLATGRSVKEIGRLVGTKIGNLNMIAAACAGTAVSALMIAAKFAPMTYVMAISGLAPIIGTLLTGFFLKEKLSPRIIFGVMLAIVGIFVMSYEPPGDGDFPLFYLGIIVAFAAALGWGCEGLFASYASDMTDPKVATAVYRTLFSGIWQLCIIGPIMCVALGFSPFEVFKVFGLMFTNGALWPWIIIGSAFAAVNNLSIYYGYNTCGVPRGIVLNSTYSVWSIPVGLIFASLGLTNYKITILAVIGVLIIIVGASLVIANPKELASRRNN